MAQPEPPPFDSENSPTFTAAGAAAAGSTLAPGARLGAYLPVLAPASVYAVVIAFYAGAGVLFGSSLLNRLCDRPRASVLLRAAPIALALVILGAQSSRAVFDANDRFMEQSRYNGFGVVELSGPVLLAVASVFLARQAGTITRRRTRP